MRYGNPFTGTGTALPIGPDSGLRLLAVPQPPRNRPVNVAHTVSSPVAICVALVIALT